MKLHFQTDSDCYDLIKFKAATFHCIAERTFCSAQITWCRLLNHQSRRSIHHFVCKKDIKTLATTADI